MTDNVPEGVIRAIEAIEAAAEAAWQRNREIVAQDGMEMPSWRDARLDVKQRWRENTAAAISAYLASAIADPSALIFP